MTTAVQDAAATKAPTTPVAGTPCRLQTGIDKSMPEGKNPSADLTSAVLFSIT
jgi:hypothetical protein